MVDLEPNSCRICLLITQPEERQALVTDEATLSDIGLLYEALFSLPISTEDPILQFVCNSCHQQMEMFKELHGVALETYCLLIDFSNCSTIECLDEAQAEGIDPKDEKCSLVEEDLSENESNADVFEDLEEVLSIKEEMLEDMMEENSEEQEEDYLEEAEETLRDESSIPEEPSERSNLHSCLECNQTFQLKTDLTLHRRVIHPKRQKYGCHLCPKVMYSEEGLDVHLKIHKGLPAYKCDICSKTFNQKSHYQYHILNHQNARNVICDVCQKGFISKSDLKIHMRTHTDERRFTCDICGKQFRANSHMVNHRYSHFEKQFECPVCFQKYISPNTLRTHYKAIHSKVVQFQCHLCEKTFNRKHHLQAHFKTHNKGKTKNFIEVD